jgi:hypothetical protein
MELLRNKGTCYKTHNGWKKGQKIHPSWNSYTVTKNSVSISSFAILSANMHCLAKWLLFISVQRPTFFARSPLCDRVITNFEKIIVKMSLFKRLFSKRLLLSVIEERYIVSIPYLFISFLQRLLLSPVFYLISFLFNNIQ